MNKIKIDIVGKSDISSLSAEEQWEIVGAFADAIRNDLVDSNSVIEGELKITTARRTDVELIEERFPGVIKIKEDSVLFDDPEVFRLVMAKNIYRTNYISKELLNSITSLSFQNNSKIVSFEEGPEFKNLVLSSNNFMGCANLERVNLDGVKFGSNVVYLFHGCNKLKTIDLSNCIIQPNTNMTQIVGTVTSELSIIFPTGVKPQTLYRMFYNSDKLQYVNLQDIDTSQCVSLFQALYCCRSLRVIDVSTWDTSSCTSMDRIFYAVKFDSFKVNAPFFNCFLRDSSPVSSLSLSDATFWVNKEEISHMLSVLPDLTPLSRTASLQLSSTTFAQVTADQISDAAAKGWNVYE